MMRITLTNELFWNMTAINIEIHKIIMTYLIVHILLLILSLD